jgi:hypothetical protein
MSVTICRGGGRGAYFTLYTSTLLLDRFSQRKEKKILLVLVVSDVEVVEVDVVVVPVVLVPTTIPVVVKFSLLIHTRVVTLCVV